MEHDRVDWRARPDATVVEHAQVRRNVVRTAPTPRVQRKLAVGAVDDPAEREADRVADDVMSILRRTASQAPPALQGSSGGTRIRRHFQPAGDAAGPAGGPLDADLAGRIRRSSTGGVPLPDPIRRQMEGAFDSDFSDVLVHRESGLAPLIGATAFTHGDHIHFAPGAYDTSAAGGQRLLAHELTHVVQQRGPSMPVRRSARGNGVIYRHASFEHLMLGQVDPRDLRAIPDDRGDLLLDDGSNHIDVKKGNGYHVLRQERERLRAWQQARPKTLDDVDTDWGVEAVEIKSTTGGGSTICTYGEMNMLADYFGSPDELHAASADTVFKLLQTERSEYYIKLGEMLNEFAATDFVLKTEKQHWPRADKQVKYYLPENAPLKDDYTPDDYTVREGDSRLTAQTFEGDQRFTKPGSDTTNLVTMLGLEPLLGVGGLLPKDEGLKNFYDEDRGTGTAWGVTARNACHFAPESWRSWETYHQDALGLAAKASDFWEAAQAPGSSEKERDHYVQVANDLANEARLVNGFGDHYLQDSFASGHLINKALVMQWYMDEIKNWWFWGPSSKEWSRLMNMSEQNQPNLAPSDYSRKPGVEAHNPQAAANMNSPEGAWDSLGLQTMDLSAGARHVLAVMRAQGPGSITIDRIIQLATPGHPQPAQIRQDADELLRRGLAWFHTGEEHEDRDRDPDEYELVNVARPSSGQRANLDDDTATKTVTANIYHEWLQNALIQAGSGALHDHFCKQGLWVSTGKNERVFKLYGDDRMLSANAGDGVEWAAETARMSQANITNVLRGAPLAQGQLEIARIMKRFPSYVIPEFADPSTVYKAKEFGLDQFRPPHGQPLRLDRWHTDLKGYMQGSYLKSLFKTWSHHYASRVVGQRHLVPFELTSPHAGSEF